MGREYCEEFFCKIGKRLLIIVSINKLFLCCYCCGVSYVDGIEYFIEEEEDGKVEVD